MWTNTPSLYSPPYGEDHGKAFHLWWNDEKVAAQPRADVLDLPPKVNAICDREVGGATLWRCPKETDFSLAELIASEKLCDSCRAIWLAATDAHEERPSMYRGEWYVD